MSSFGSGSTTTAGASITLRNYTGTDGNQAGTDGLVPGPGIAQAGYVLGAQGDWTITVSAIDDLNDATNRIATTAFVQNRVAQIVAGGGGIALGGIQDVDLAGLVDNQLLQYNLGDAEWQPLTLTVASISDVNLAGLQDGNALVYSAAANNNAGGWVPGEGGGGGAESLNGLGDVTINGGADKHFLVRNGAGQYENRLISTADLSDEANIALTNRATTFGAFAYDFTASTITVPAPTQNAHASTKLYVDTQVSTRQASDATLTALAGVVTVADKLIYATGADAFATTDLTGFGRTLIANDNAEDARTDLGLGTAAESAVGDFLASDASIGALSDVDLTGVGLNQGDGRVLVWDEDAGGVGRFITAEPAVTYTNEEARDAAGTALAGGNNTGISFVNDDANDRINATVDITGFSVRDLSDVSNDALVNGKILKVVNNVLTQADETDTNTQLSDEQVQDIVGAMVNGGTETDITVSYDDAAGKLDFVVDATVARLADPNLTGTPTAPTAAHDTNTTQLATTEFVLSQIAGTDINILESVNTAEKAEGKILKYDANGVLVVSDDEGKTQEEIEDIVGGMVEGNTETGITVTYQAGDNTLDFEVGGLLDAQIAGNASISVDKLASKAITLGSSTLNLGGGAVTSITGMTGIDFTNANATIGASMTNDGENPPVSTVLTLGGAGSTVAIAGTLTVNAPVNGTDATTKTYVDTQVATKQDSNTNLTSLSGLNIIDGSMIIGNGDNSFEIITIQGGVESFLKTTGRIAALSDVTFDNDELNNANHFIVSTGAGGFQNQTISTANLSNSGNIILNNAGADFGAFDYNFTGANSITVPAPNNGADATTKTYVDTQVATKQTSDATLTALAGLATGAKKLIYSNTGDDDLEMIGLSDNAKTFIASDAGVADLDNVNLGGVGNALADGQTLRYDGANTEWKNSKLAFGDLDQNAGSTQNVALLNQEQTFSNNITFTANVDLTGATSTAETVANNDQEGNSTRVATTAFVKTVLAQVGGVSALDDLTDVNLGVKVIEIENAPNENDGVALANAHILVYDSDAGHNDNSFKNVALSGDIEITNAGVATIQSGAITLAKIGIIDDDAITNAKLANEYVTFSDGTDSDNLSLGQTVTFNAVASETTVDVAADVGAGVSITIGLPDDVTIAQDLTVTRNLIVNGTTTTLNTATLDVEDTIIRLNKGVANGANPNDIGLFFERGTTGDDAIFFWDEGDDFFKLGLTNNDDHEATDFGPSTTPGGLQIGSLELRDANPTSLVIREGNNSYLTFDTSDGTEKVVFGKVFEAVTASKIGDLTLGSGSITDSSGAISFGDENLSTTGTANFGATTVDSLDASSGGITQAGAISGISSLAGSDLDLNLTDDEATAFEVKGDVKAVGNNSYLTFVTTDNSEEVVFNQGGVDIDFRVEGEAQTHLLYADATNDRIGINTDTPLAQVHVVGSTVLVGGLTQSGASTTFNNGEEDFDFRVAGNNQSNLFFVDASTDRVGVRTNTPAKILDVVGDVGISTTLDVTGKTTLAGSLDLTTDSTTGITFRSEIAENGADAGGDISLLRVNVGGTDGAGNPNFQKVIWNPDSDRFEVESGLKSTGNFTVGGDLATINATTGVTSIKGATTINNSGGTADLIVQNNGADVLNVDVSAGLTAITGNATVSSQLKTDDLRGLTAGTGNFHIRLEDNIANALEILDATNALSFMTFTTTDGSESITLSQDAIFKNAISIENSNTNGLFFNSNRSGEVSEDATLITVEGGSNKNDVVLAWDTSDNALNLNGEAQVHLQGLAGSNALTIGGALVANATITMTTAGAITLDGTLDSPTINTDKITDKAGDGLVVELADALNGNALLVSDAGGSNYLTVNTSTEKVTLHKGTTVSNTLAVSMQTTLGGILNLKFDAASPLIKANSDRTAENAEADATLIEVERGVLANAKFKWDETSDCFEFDALLSAEGNFQVGTNAAAPVATINSTTGNLSTDGTISATSSITTASVLNFSTASQGAILFNSDLGNGANPDDADDFGLTVNRGALADAKLYWDEGDNVWSIETGNVQITESLVVDSDAGGAITVSTGSITSASGAISFDDENLTTTGSITSGAVALATNDTTVATTAFVKGQKLGDFDQVDTSGFDTSGQVLVWNQEQSKFEKGTSIYNAELARDDVGAALAGGTHTGATTITFTNDDANNFINLALGITTEDLTDVSADQATNNQVLRFTTAEGDNQNKYVPTTLGTAADVDTGLSNGNVPTLATHTWSTKTNETADLIITGRYIEAIDYGSVDEAFDENTDWALDFGSVADAGISSWEDYGQLVV